MPKFPKGFGRRKSAAKELDDVRGAVAEPSFKVFEREDSTSKPLESRRKFVRSATVPKTSLMTDDDNMFENIYNRDSGASNANTFSTTDNSSRLSAASTAPSSTDIPRRDEWKTPHDRPFSDIPVPPVPKSSSAFSLKNAGRSLSWGRHSKGTPLPIAKTTPPESPVLEDDHSTSRQRAVTASSYASTATPPKLDEKDLGLSLGGDFSDMFGGFGKRKSAVMDAETKTAISRSPETAPPGPATRSLTASRLNQPSPLSIDYNKKIEPSPYSWSSQNSHDGLMSSSTTALASRNTSPPVPQHSTLRTYDSSPPHSRTQRTGGPTNSGLRRSSAVMEPHKRQSTLDYGDALDEDARLLRESLSASRRMNDTGHDSKVRDSWALPSTASYKVDDATLSTWPTASEATPRAKKPMAKESDDNLFDVNIAASADLAERFHEKSESPPATYTAPQNKVMTPAQFERYKQDQERLGSYGGHSKEDEDEEEPYDDDEDEAEKNKQLAKQRRKQEAHMSVYRQQMMKVTGEAIPPARPNVYATQSSPNLGLPGAEDAEEDEEVPLAILQAHGFPNKGKQQMRSMGSNPNMRSSAQMVAGGVVGADSRLPVFARHLPQDPYLGAGLVNPMHRESLAFGGGAGSVSGAAPRGPPGGLVGVIANEERSRAMRRGSPNPQGDYGSAAGGGFSPAMGMQPPAFGSSNGMGQGAPMGPMNTMMLTPGDQAQIQMSQQMQQFMQMQMQFMQIMTAGGQAPPGQMQPSGELPRPGSAQQLRPGSSHPQMGSQHQRAMTMLDPNAVPWMQNGSQYAHSQGGGYAPSIAPSERSNVGLPGRYRPVSQAPPQVQHNHTRASTMSGAINGWGDKSGANIKTVKKPGNVSDEDDEEGWEEMAKKRQQKKSLWRTKKDKDTNGLKDLMGYAQ
ncbi:hypothetical protein BUE80_DR010571 [Diplocarpon rosae]|nr:hypothetical protein BUE80_DR010571 [Diplocarpon rosae]